MVKGKLSLELMYGEYPEVDCISGAVVILFEPGLEWQIKCGKLNVQCV